MPYTVIRMIKGLTLEQKRALVKDVTEVIARDLGCPAQSVVIELEEFAPENMVDSGQSPAGS